MHLQLLLANLSGRAIRQRKLPETKAPRVGLCDGRVGAK